MKFIMNRFELYSKKKIIKEVKEVKSKKPEPNTAAEEVAEPSSDDKNVKSSSESYTIYIRPWVHKENTKDGKDKHYKLCLYLQYSYDLYLYTLSLEIILPVKIMRT